MTAAGNAAGLAELGDRALAYAGARPDRRLDRCRPGWRSQREPCAAGLDYHRPAPASSTRLDLTYEAKALPLLEPGDLPS